MSGQRDICMAKNRIIVIGAGMGGLTAAIRLARAGVEVQLLEARRAPGGLAAGLELEGLRFDAGPYILLDRPGLEWAFRAVGMELGDHVPLRRIDDIYEVQTPDGSRVRFQSDLEATAAAFERQWPGSAARYVNHVQAMTRIYARLEPLQRAAPSGLGGLIRAGGWRHLWFLLRSLDTVLKKTGLPAPVCAALAIWTHVAGQRVEEAPSPLALVPALLHGVGAYYAVGGIGRIPQALAAAAKEAGAAIDYGVTVMAIRRRDGGRAGAVLTDQGGVLEADAILANSGGIGTYVDLLESPPPALRAELEKLPLQSPGVIAYLAVKPAFSQEDKPPYLRFMLPGGQERCRCLVMPAVLEPEMQREGWHPARLLGPMDHGQAQAVGPNGQQEYLNRILAEPWWREQIRDYRVLGRRTPAQWGAEYHLYRDSMNPVMTARFMRAGRLAHRSSDVRGLYLAGSSTHPGQWVSFCAISGILAADKLLEDLR
jgi:phytoene dehydrogenase-like protein